MVAAQQLELEPNAQGHITDIRLLVLEQFGAADCFAIVFEIHQTPENFDLFNVAFDFATRNIKKKNQLEKEFAESRWSHVSPALIRR